jgi:superfamily II DNA or RNA helicase
MKQVHIWVRDEVYCNIVGLEPADVKFLWNKYGIEVEGSFYMPARRLGRWDGKLRFFDDKTGKVFLRFLDEIVPFIDAWGYQIELHDERRPVEPVQTRLTKDWFNGRSQVQIEIRPYQVQAVNKCLDNGSGIIEAATGAGKTIMVAGLVSLLGEEGLRTITIVPSSDLVDQTSNTFTLCGLEHGLYSGAEKNLREPHVIATWQALQNNPHLITEFNCVIVDEAHGASAQTIGDLITNHGKHIPYRFGFTGTIPKQETAQATLRGSLGETLYKISAAQLIELGYLAKLEIEPVEIQEKVDEEFPDYSSEKAYTSKSADRLDFIADLIISRAAQYGNTLVLVHTIKQGQQLQKLIRDSVFLQGATENDVRAEWYSSFADRDDLIVIATSGIASTGISIDRVFQLMLIDAGKSFIKCIQSIGRGLRRGHDKDFVHVTDVYTGLKWGRKHARERAKYYKDAGYPVLKVSKVKL